MVGKTFEDKQCLNQNSQERTFEVIDASLHTHINRGRGKDTAHSILGAYSGNKGPTSSEKEILRTRGIILARTVSFPMNFPNQSLVQILRRAA